MKSLLPLVRRTLPLLLLVPLLASAQSERLRIHGSNVLGHELVPALLQAWLHEAGYAAAPARVHDGAIEIAATRDGVELIVEIRTDGSASAFADLIGGNAEIGMSARPPSERELDDAWLLGNLRSPDQEFVVAVDGLAMLVHADNPLRALSTAQLRDVFRGRIRDWSQLGGRPGPIHVLGTAPASGNHQLLAQLLLDGAESSAQTRVLAGSAAIAAAVAADPQAIGYVAIGQQAPRTVALAVSSGAAPIAPTVLNVLAEDYPLVRRLSFYGAQMMSALGRAFATYAVSPAGQGVVARHGYLALAPSALEATPPAGLPDEYESLVAGAHRVGTSLRFGRGYSVLDSRGVQDFERLVAFMHRDENRGRELMLVGFADVGTGGPSGALFLSHDRVDFIADLLIDAGVHVTRQRGYGSSAPLFAGDAARARYVNERIEVWMR